jgi:transcriptional regulator with XRE-family HTH domain
VYGSRVLDFVVLQIEEIRSALCTDYLWKICFGRRVEMLRGKKFVRPEPEISLAEMVSLLFEYGKEVTGRKVTNQLVADSTGMAVNTVRGLRIGEITNPGYRTLKAVADFFGIGLGYFNCLTEEECRQYIANLSAPQEAPGLRMRSLPVKVEKDDQDQLLQTLQDIVERIEKLEEQQLDQDDEEENET